MGKKEGGQKRKKGKNKGRLEWNEIKTKERKMEETRMIKRKTKLL